LVLRLAAVSIGADPFFRSRGLTLVAAANLRITLPVLVIGVCDDEGDGRAGILARRGSSSRSFGCQKFLFQPRTQLAE
jgi:hypothetical protein